MPHRIGVHQQRTITALESSNIFGAAERVITWYKMGIGYEMGTVYCSISYISRV